MSTNEQRCFDSKQITMAEAKELMDLAVREAVRVEREACAAECERMIMFDGARQESFAHDGVQEAAKAIRARGDK